MSNISSLSSDYWRASDFSQRIDRALLVLKRAVLNLPSARDLKPDEVANSAQRLAELLGVLANLVESGAAGAPAEGVERVPAEFLARLSSESVREPDRKSPAELREMAGKLSHGDPSAITAEDVAVLDDIAALADSDASETFRDLVRS